MTGPYEQVTESTGMPVLRGRIELEWDGQKLVAEVLSGDATLELVDQCDDVVTAFGAAEPVRYVNRRWKVRLVVEAGLDQLNITTEPGNG